ncbi:leucine-rich repeat-containing protein 59 [Hylaeus volcanicus]|uniref:leucine-rich repeat-containing protein 59 n=1 Tax=Hylaeus volcanicus TaxID=313075 RepID=UPI0023B84639|nr:leucine-rich repeat-containing protein 59 [Hylaeus volcanicus]
MKMKSNSKNIKDRLKDETLDLSLCDLKEVPVREIAAVKKATHLDLSNNLLVSLPNTFVSLKQIVKLDLSKNMLTEIPENFGELRQLRHLDLYANQISRLPLSLSELKNLRWLDLKENPLTPAVSSVAGPCSNLSECQACARNIVTYLSRVKVTIEEERLRRSNAVTNAETDLNAVAKKGGKKKKKKSVEKDNKQDMDKNGCCLVSEELKVGGKQVEVETLGKKDKYVNKKYASKGNGCQSLLSTFVWLLLIGLIFTLSIVILPMYSEQSELFVKYIEKSTGVPLKAFQKQSIDTLRSSVRIGTTWTRQIYDNFYDVYEKNFRRNRNVPDSD